MVTEYQSGEGSVSPLPVYRGDVVVAFAVVDSSSYAELSQYHWLLNDNGYAYRSRHGAEGRGSFQLSRHVLGLTTGDPLEADHIDRQRLNNSRRNLRPVSTAQNAQNRGPQPGSSKYRGVTWCAANQRWHAQVKLHGKLNNLGHFENEDDAGRVASHFRQQTMPYTNEPAELLFAPPPDRERKASSQFVGVVWSRDANRWFARGIGSTGRRNVHLGAFEIEADAVIALAHYEATGERPAVSLARSEARKRQMTKLPSIGQEQKVAA